MTSDPINLTKLRDFVNEQHAENPTAPFYAEPEWVLALIDIAAAAHEALDALGVGDGDHETMVREHGPEVTRLRETLNRIERT